MTTSQEAIQKETESKSLCYLTSCTYCCGLNTGKNTKEELTDILTRRTELYKQMVKGKKDVSDYMEKVAENETWQFIPSTQKEQDEAYLGDLVRCRLIGFIDDKDTKVGCMAYPKDKNDETNDYIRAVYTDIHIASEIIGAAGRDLGICKNHQCQASTMYKQLPSNLKDIVELFIEDIDWYDISRNPKSSKESPPLTKITTMAYFDYVLDRLEEKGFSKDKESVKKVFNNIGLIARDIIDLSDKWTYKTTQERIILSSKHNMEDLPVGTYWTKSLEEKLPFWTTQREKDSAYKIIINRDKNIVLELEALSKPLKKTQTIFIQNGRPTPQYRENYYYDNSEIKEEDMQNLRKEELICSEEFWFDWDGFKHNYCVNDFTFTKESLFDRRSMREHNNSQTTKKDRLEKIFSHLDSFFVSKKEMNEATKKIDNIIDGAIDSLLSDSEY